MKRITIISLLVLVFLFGCAGSQFTQKESPRMLQIKEECKQKTMFKANVMSGWTINDDAYWQDILANSECRDFYEKCLRDKGYVKK